MHDPFEASLKALLNSPAHAQDEEGDDQARLHRVLKTANRQVGAGALFDLVGRHWMSALLLALGNGAPHIKPRSRRSTRTAPSPETPT
ncbi:CrfX protein [Pseudomonas oryzihabitans]|uniref:CrfX protein n=1 Tax=Pseudomonas oryzihabitans TaxID=47885 RepID=UPI00119EB530|nr:CrfX protein [Pseudomonas psychrotolerans]